MSNIADKLSNAIDDLIRAHVQDAMCDPDDEVGYDKYTPREALAGVIDEFAASLLSSVLHGRNP